MYNPMAYNDAQLQRTVAAIVGSSSCQIRILLLLLGFLVGSMLIWAVWTLTLPKDFTAVM